jgi:hypothetical protein
MILIKPPYTPVVPTSTTTQFNVYGKSFYKITNVYLSGYPYPNTTLYNPFSAIRKLSATNPAFFGIKLSSSNYKSNNDNTITFTMPSALRPGTVDVIVENPAGYGKLTRFVIKELYNTSFTQNQLRPWSTGVNVVTATAMPPRVIFEVYSIDGNEIITIDGNNVITI